MAKAKAPSEVDPFEKISVRFFLAEDFIQQVGGKITVISLFSDNVVVAHRPVGVPEPSELHPLVFDRMSFMATVSGLDGNFDVSWQFNEKVTGADTPHKVKSTTFHVGKSANLVVTSRPFASVSYGKKQLILKIGDRSFPFDFEIRQGEPTLAE